MSKFITLIIILWVSFNTFGGGNWRQGWHGGEIGSSQDGVDGTVGLIISISFLIFVIYVAFRVWKSIKELPK